MKKSLIAAASAVAVMVGGTSPSWAFFDDTDAVAVSVLVQANTNNAPINTMNALLQAQGNVLNNNFGPNTFREQVLNQNNFNTGANAQQQGANTVAIGVTTNSF